MAELSELSREQLQAMGLTEEQIDSILGVVEDTSGGDGLPFPIVKVNYDGDVGKVGSLCFNPNKNEDGVVFEYEKEFDGAFKVRFLKSVYQYTKFDPTTNKVTIASNIFSSLSEAKKAYDIKSGIAITTLKEDGDDDIKLSRISLVELIDGDDVFYGVWFVKGAYLFELNNILQGFKNEAHLNKVLTIKHKKNKKGRVVYFTPELVEDSDYDFIKTIKEDSEKITQFSKWASKDDKPSNAPQEDIEDEEDDEEIAF